ncbi:MAG: alpha/beta hydrolase [Dehalococcoidia bacterium]
MSEAQRRKVDAKVQAVFSSWTPETSLEQIRREWDALFSDYVPAVKCTATPVSANGVQAEWIVAPGARAGRTILYLHGGGYVLGSITSHRDIIERLSHAARARVLALDYRLAPEHPFPAPVEDALAAYRWLLDQGVAPSSLAISGDSAGGGLALATMLALKTARTPLPACAALMSPWVDMEVLGESMTTKDAVDPMVHRPMVETMVQLFLGNGDRRNPLANPLYGDFTELPPMIVHSGTRETLLDDAVRVVDKARKAGVDVDYKIWEDQMHVFHIFAARLDEGADAIRELGAFIERHLR